ncbi:MAG: polysaccharide deacetylase family protein [Fimbriimonadaceae bacterium]|nr:polysaccharide deacetylase family protein [Fimbriimonadaceae bacterium]
MPWPVGKRWVYSVTYDEGCAALLDHVVPLHQRHDLPGHVALVASQIGVPRNVPGSSFDGLPILTVADLTGLRAGGWGVSCHGLTHAAITPSNAAEEVVRAKAVIEATLGWEVPIFCVPNNNDGYPASRQAAPAAGYRAILTIYDAVNPPDVDPWRLARVPIHSEYPPPFYSAWDPYKRLHQARDLGGWVIDYCHCPLPGRTLHPWKDCTLEQLAERFETVRRVGGEEVWLAEPNAVLDWLCNAPGDRDGW